MRTAIENHPLAWRHDLLLVVPILIIAAGFRLWDMDRTGIWEDEGFSFYQANRDFLGMIVETARDNYPPLHNIILWFTIKLVGTSETIIRLPSAALGVAAVFAIYRVGELIGPRGAGLGAAALLAVLPAHIWHSVEARMYSLLALAAIGFIWATLVHWRKPSSRTAFVLTVTTFLLLLTHIYGSFLGTSVFAFLLLHAWAMGRLGERGVRLWIVSQLVAAALFAPWMVALIGRSLRLMGGGFWIPYPTADFLGIHLDRILGTAPLVGLILLGGIHAIRLVATTRRNGVAPSRDAVGLENGLLLVWLLGPLAIGYALSLLAFPILHNRYLMVSAPAAMLVLSRAVLALPLPSVARVAGLALFVAALLPAAVHQVTAYRAERHDLRSAALLMERHRRAGDFVMPVRSHLVRAIEYYTGPLEHVVRHNSVEKYLVPIEEYDRVWMILASKGLDIRESMLESYGKAGFELKLRGDFYRTTLVLMERAP